MAPDGDESTAGKRIEDGDTKVWYRKCQRDQVVHKARPEKGIGWKNQVEEHEYGRYRVEFTPRVSWKCIPRPDE